MKISPSFDIAIIGAGLAGLTSAIYAARAGRSVMVFEKAPQAGGRASTQTMQDFCFNQGPHALYRAGHGRQVLREIGIGYQGSPASYEGSWVLSHGRKYPFPGRADLLATSELFSPPAREEALAFFAALPQMPCRDYDSIPLDKWFDKHVKHGELRELLEGMVRLSTYCADFSRLSAGAAWEQVIMGGKEGVDYLDGGWKSLVDSLRQAAEEAGAVICTRGAVQKINSRQDQVIISLADGSVHAAKALISTVEPRTLARVLQEGRTPFVQQWAVELTPVHAACLDVALRSLPDASHQFALGLDVPFYYSVHTRSAKLAPDGGAVIQLAKYLDTHEEAGAAETREELETLMDQMQPGWRGELVDKRFLAKMVVTHAIAPASLGGTLGRPGPRVPELANVFVAGDWVGPHGMLADTSLTSARDAAQLALHGLEESSGAPLQQSLAAV